MESTLRRGAGAPGLALIETLGWDGVTCVRLDLHLARLAGAAARLGWACDLVAVRDELTILKGTLPARLRLTLEARGKVSVTTADMPDPATLWQVGLANDRLASDDPWLGIKSTNRAVYDRARTHMQAELDEVIFQNEHGEVCDGSITTVFFDAGHGLCTPPLGCGLLPGVLRAEMLALGTLREAVLHATDLASVQLMVGNSLRGLIPAVFVHQIRA